MYRIYDNRYREWVNKSFAILEEAEKYVMYDLRDLNFKIYSIYKYVK